MTRTHRGAAGCRRRALLWPVCLALLASSWSGGPAPAVLAMAPPSAKDISWMPPTSVAPGMGSLVVHHPLAVAGHSAVQATALDPHYAPWAPVAAVNTGARPGMGSALETLMLHSLLAPSSSTSSTTPSTAQKCMSLMAPMMMGSGVAGGGNPMEKMVMMQALMGSSGGTGSTTAPKMSDCMKDPTTLMLMMGTGVDGTRGAGAGLASLGGGALPPTPLQHSLMMMQLAHLLKPASGSSSSSKGPDPVSMLMMAGLMSGHGLGGAAAPGTMGGTAVPATVPSAAVPVVQPRDVVVHVVSQKPLPPPPQQQQQQQMSLVAPLTAGNPTAYALPSVGGMAPIVPTSVAAAPDPSCPSGGAQHLLGLRTSYGLCI